MRKQICEIDRTIGERLRFFRQARRLSQSAVGSRIGTTYQQVQRYESAGNGVSASSLWRIARALDVCVTEFFPSDDIYERLDPVLTASIARLPPHLRSIIGDLADAIADEERASMR